MALRASSLSTGRSTQASGWVACIFFKMCTSAPTAPSYLSLAHLHTEAAFCQICNVCSSFCSLHVLPAAILQALTRIHHNPLLLKALIGVFHASSS